jgi:hypothetical protein
MDAAWCAGIEPVEFQPHSLYLDRSPMGREATLSDNTIDVVVDDLSPDEIVVAAEATESRLTVRCCGISWAEVETTSDAPSGIRPGETRAGSTSAFGRTSTCPDGSIRSEDHAHTYGSQDGRAQRSCLRAGVADRSCVAPLGPVTMVRQVRATDHCGGGGSASGEATGPWRRCSPWQEARP